VTGTTLGLLTTQPLLFISFLISDFAVSEHPNGQVPPPTAFTRTNCNWRGVDITVVFIQIDRYKYTQLLYTQYDF
jgi:hypothetical protein